MPITNKAELATALTAMEMNATAIFSEIAQGQLKIDALFSRIKDQYKKLALKYHPDRNPGSTTATEKFQKLSNTLEELNEAKNNGSLQEILAPTTSSSSRSGTSSAATDGTRDTSPAVSPRGTTGNPRDVIRAHEQALNQVGESQQAIIERYQGMLNSLGEPFAPVTFLYITELTTALKDTFDQYQAMVTKKLNDMRTLTEDYSLFNRTSSDQEQFSACDSNVAITLCQLETRFAKLEAHVKEQIDILHNLKIQADYQLALCKRILKPSKKATEQLAHAATSIQSKINAAISEIIELCTTGSIMDLDADSYIIHRLQAIQMTYSREIWEIRKSFSDTPRMDAASPQEQEHEPVLEAAPPVESDSPVVAEIQRPASPEPAASGIGVELQQWQERLDQQNATIEKLREGQAQYKRQIEDRLLRLVTTPTMHGEISQSVNNLMTPLVDMFNTSLAVMKGQQTELRNLHSQGEFKLCEGVAYKTDAELQRLTEATQALEDRISMQIEVMESLKKDTEEKLDAYRQSLDSYPLLTKEIKGEMCDSVKGVIAGPLDKIISSMLTYEGRPSFDMENLLQKQEAGLTLIQHIITKAQHTDEINYNLGVRNQLINDLNEGFNENTTAITNLLEMTADSDIQLFIMSFEKLHENIISDIFSTSNSQTTIEECRIILKDGVDKYVALVNKLRSKLREKECDYVLEELERLDRSNRSFNYLTHAHDSLSTIERGARSRSPLFDSGASSAIKPTRSSSSTPIPCSDSPARGFLDGDGNVFLSMPEFESKLLEVSLNAISAIQTIVEDTGLSIETLNEAFDSYRNEICVEIFMSCHDKKSVPRILNEYAHRYENEVKTLIECLNKAGYTGKAVEANKLYDLNPYLPKYYLSRRIAAESHTERGSARLLVLHHIDGLFAEQSAAPRSASVRTSSNNSTTSNNTRWRGPTQ